VYLDRKARVSEALRAPLLISADRTAPSIVDAGRTSSTRLAPGFAPGQNFLS
jgi:hypothetical protein